MKAQRQSAERLADMSDWYTYKRHYIGKGEGKRYWSVYNEKGEFLFQVPTTQGAIRKIDQTYSWEDFHRDESAAIAKTLT